MSITNNSEREIAVSISIGDDGNVVLFCPTCLETWIVSIRLAASPFWEVFIGSALLTAINHYQEDHVQTRRH